MVDSRADPDPEVTPGQSFRGNGPASMAARDLLGNGTTREERSINMASAQRMNRRRLKNLAVIALGLGLASLGAYNIVVKATGSLMDDGVFWKSGTGGVVASRVAPGGPAARAGVCVGDILLGIDGEDILSAGQVEAILARHQPGGPAAYSLLRLGDQRGLEVRIQPLPQGNVTLFYYLSLVGFFSLAVGTIVMLRRPADRSAVHFYTICVLFFLVYSTSYTGRLDVGDWVLFWADLLAVLFLPVVFLHFCLSFPERRLKLHRIWLIPAIYMPALALAGAALASPALLASGGDATTLWRISEAMDRGKPLYFAALFAISFAVLLDSYRRTRALTARRQMKWLVWGTGAGVLPFFVFYAIPFALGREPRLAMELAGYMPLALLPLALAYAVVKHRLMDVELIFRRTIAYTLAVAAILGISLLTIGLTNVILADEEPHTTIIALLSTLVVILLFTPVKSRILESIDSGMLVLDLEGQVVRWNRAMEGLYGKSREDVLGRSLDDILPPSFLEALRGSLVLGGREEIAHIYKLHLPTADGRSLMVNVSVAPFQIGSGERCGTVLILDDITARVRLEEQLQHSEKMASIGILAAGVAHEVNTPLAGISSYTQILKGLIDSRDPRAALLDKIEKQSFRAAKIINNLLNFSRSAGAEMERLDVNKTLLDVLSLIEHQLEGSKIRVRKELAAELPPVRGNENRVQQVFFNLILNARDAMPRGGWLTLTTSADDDTVVVEVSDTGVGIKREDIKRIYDPFFTTKGIGRGTGLGLSVSYGIVQEHGGAIFVDSVPGKGSTFQVALPALAPAEAAREVR